ncbi:MAG: DUF1552 domain-containing protein [Phycisphaera sp.]|nr:DUF1552 domain-containing protein [Phycisphaera sp.]
MRFRPLSRRTFLRGAGVAMGLPVLDAMAVRTAYGEKPVDRTRMVAINVGLGLHVPHMIPEKAGREFELPLYLKQLADLREKFTVLSGVSHPGVDGGHLAEKSFLTAATHPGSASFKNTISLDQFAAEKVGDQTRFASLALSLAGRGLAWSRSGVEVPSYTRPSEVFAALFLEGKPAEKRAQIQRLKDGQSVLDMVREKSKRMSQRLGAADRDKLDQFFTSVRDTETRLVKAEAWEHKPKPHVDVAPPKDINDSTDVIGRAELMYDMTYLALQTDSTRVVSFFKNGINAVPPINGVTQDYHNLSHHGKDPAKIKELAIIEGEQLRIFGEFLRKLQKADEGGVSLLDKTMVLLGSNLGNASSHNNSNLPVVFAGGGFRHGQHLAFDHDKNEPLANLFVTMLQRLGVETDTFATGTTTMRGIEA